MSDETSLANRCESKTGTSALSEAKSNSKSSSREGDFTSTIATNTAHAAFAIVDHCSFIFALLTIEKTSLTIFADHFAMAMESVEAHHLFATKVKPDRNQSKDLSLSRSTCRALRGAEIKSTSDVNSIPNSQDTANFVDHCVLGPEIVRQHYRDVGSKYRVKKRQTVIDNAHKSMARHAVSAYRKRQNLELFQNRLRLDHATGKYDEVNWADPQIPIAGIGIALERLSIPSLLLPQAVMHELKVSYVDPNGAAGLSKRVKVGDVLLKACITVRVYVGVMKF
jgi:hypothetical protein